MIFLSEEDKEPFDVIVVLGAAVWKGGMPSPVLKRRVLHAVNLIKNGRAKYLLFTGGLGKYPPIEARVMKDLAIKEGIPPKRIILEEESTSTFESAVRCIQIMRKHKWSKAIIVSDPYHLLRATFLFRSFGVKAVGSGAKGGRKSNPLWKWVYYYIREAAALLWYLILIVRVKICRKGDSVQRVHLK